MIGEGTAKSSPDEVARFGLVAKGNVTRGHGWALSSDFECGNGQEFVVHGPDRASFCPEPDIVTEWDDKAYTYFFCARITNEAPTARRLALEIRAPRERFWRGWTAAQQSPVTVLAGLEGLADGADPAAWRVVSPLAEETNEDVVAVPLEVTAGGSVYVAHHFWYPWSRIEARLRLLAAVRPDVERIEIGHTAQGRAISGLRLHALGELDERREQPASPVRGGQTPAAGAASETADTASAPRVVVTGTMQASEGGHLLALWALEWLLSEAPSARAVRRRFTFDVVPASNPDGIVLGACMTNSVGQYAFYDAGAAARGEPASSETAAMLGLVEGRVRSAHGADGAGGADAAGGRDRADAAGGLSVGSPDEPVAGYLEYHSTFHTGRPTVAYNLSGDVLPDGEARARYARTTAALLEVSKGKEILVQKGAAHFAETVTYLAAKRFGTAAHLFKIDTGLGPVAYHAQCIEALERYLAALGDASV
jgi:hypothetical protein